MTLKTSIRVLRSGIASQVLRRFVRLHRHLRALAVRRKRNSGIIVLDLNKQTIQLGPLTPAVDRNRAQQAFLRLYHPEYGIANPLYRERVFKALEFEIFINGLDAWGFYRLMATDMQFEEWERDAIVQEFIEIAA